MRILHVADSGLDLVRVPCGAAGRADIRAGFERAVQAAIDHDVDVFLHAGGLFNWGADVPGDEIGTWQTSCFERLAAAGVTAIVHETGPALAYGPAVVLAAGDVVHERGARFVSGLGRGGAVSGIEVRAVWGKTPGIPTARGDVGPPAIDATELAACGASYVALAGTRTQQLVQPNAAYAGATAPVDRFCDVAPRALLVEIGDATARVTRIASVRLPNRAVLRIAIDGSGMGSELLGSVVHARIESALRAHEAWRQDVIARLGRQGESPELVARVAAIYGRAGGDSADAAGDGVSWVPRRPLIDISVSNALATREEVWESEPRLAWPVEQDQVCQLMVAFDGARPEKLVRHAEDEAAVESPV